MAGRFSGFGVLQAERADAFLALARIDVHLILLQRGVFRFHQMPLEGHFSIEEFKSEDKRRFLDLDVRQRARKRPQSLR